MLLAARQRVRFAQCKGFFATQRIGRYKSSLRQPFTSTIIQHTANTIPNIQWEGKAQREWGHSTIVVHYLGWTSKAVEHQKMVLDYKLQGRREYEQATCKVHRGNREPQPKQRQVLSGKHSELHVGSQVRHHPLRRPPPPRNWHHGAGPSAPKAPKANFS